ncbi:MAG: tautomerase family protein [Pseudomonadota bacterium]
MPLIDIQVMEGVFSDEEKACLIRKVTDGFQEVAGKTLADATSVRIHEIKSGSWGYAGQALTIDDAKAMRAKG